MKQATFSGFPTIEDALAHRDAEGGWIFESITGEVVWFSYRFTPSVIFSHHAVAGLSGRLV